MGQHSVNRTSAEGIPCSGRLDRFHRESFPFHTQILIIGAASILAHRQKDQRNLILLLQIADSLIIVLLTRDKLNLIVRNLQHVTILETVLHLLLRFIQRTPQRRT